MSCTALTKAQQTRGHEFGGAAKSALDRLLSSSGGAVGSRSAIRGEVRAAFSEDAPASTGAEELARQHLRLVANLVEADPRSRWPSLS